ncbi:MBL fold metallo-hydrolase [Chitinophaga qingshengii]|uniref:MBL fold metallo-hydrolase n=1 Tax=Chitinophaga qingshengii TaxID=1569794 RepID=A0ABR7TQH9_9BACT|nr:MBL fold metallo-hydrolase [Chitinophaga qingshengii]MBC9932731.1 MBL fold metallo-hydrolase [Chitinophaga qingshengii]
MYRLLLLFSVVSLLLPRVAGCQSADSLLRKAMAANGHWETIRAFDYATHRTSYNRWQGYSFDCVQPEQDEYEVYVDLEHRRHWHHTLAHYAGGYVFNTVRINRDAGYYVYDLGLWRTGKALLKVPGDLGEANRRIILSSFPYFILKEMLDSGDSLQVQTSHSEIVVRRITGTGTQELRFHPKTLLLASNKVITGSAVKEQYFDAYTHVGALYSLPGKMVQKQNGEDVLSDQLVRFLPLAAADTTRFSLPAGYTLQMDTTPPLRARAIAKDVYLVEKVDGDRNVLFINMDDQVLLTEAPVSGRVTRGIIELIHRTLPGKPIGYVHLSHFHNDHIGGIGELVKEGAAVICTPSMEKPVREMTGGLAPEFSFFNGHKILEDAHHRIEFFEVPNSHAQGLSFLYLPAEKLIYEGDLLSMPEDAVVTPAFKVSQEFYEYIHQHNIAYKQIIGHHGLTIITPALFRQAIDAGR